MVGIRQPGLPTAWRKGQSVGGRPSEHADGPAGVRYRSLRSWPEPHERGDRTREMVRVLARGLWSPQGRGSCPSVIPVPSWLGAQRQSVGKAETPGPTCEPGSHEGPEGWRTTPCPKKAWGLPSSALPLPPRSGQRMSSHL